MQASQNELLRYHMKMATWQNSFPNVLPLIFILTRNLYRIMHLIKTCDNVVNETSMMSYKFVFTHLQVSGLFLLLMDLKRF